MANHWTERTPGEQGVGLAATGWHSLLDLPRVLAGPTSTRWLAAFGATVLRIDPKHWDEPACAVAMSAGKRRAHLDLHSPAGQQQFTKLLRDADVLVHGYHADALERLGLGDTIRRQINPGMVDLALCAYGWTGPWRYRRGFDSLVRMSSGIAHTSAELSNTELAGLIQTCTWHKLHAFTNGA